MLFRSESYNPGHSVKDRIALYIIETAEKKGIWSGILPTTFSLSSVFSSGDKLSDDTSKASNTWVSYSPINTDTMAGGASLAPNR